MRWKGGYGVDRAFEFGLELILDGLERNAAPPADPDIGNTG